MNVHIHRILQGSCANGPGIRNVVWFQGCTLSCPGCFNPLTHDPKGGKTRTVPAVSKMLLDPSAPCDGITISGGEPFLQTAALYALLKDLREKHSPPILIFSGYSRKELFSDPARSACLSLADALICGPYRKELPPAYERFCSSGNQELVLLSGRYNKEDFCGLPLSEIIIAPDGTAVFSGISVPDENPYFLR